MHIVSTNFYASVSARFTKSFLCEDGRTAPLCTADTVCGEGGPTATSRATSTGHGVHNTAIFASHYYVTLGYRQRQINNDELTQLGTADFQCQFVLFRQIFHSMSTHDVPLTYSLHSFRHTDRLFVKQWNSRTFLRACLQPLGHTITLEHTSQPTQFRILHIFFSCTKLQPPRRPSAVTE